MALALARAAGATDAPDAAPAPAVQPVVGVVPHRVYVSNEMSGDLTVYDGASLRTLETVALGKRPRGLKIANDGRTLYVALSGSPFAPPGVDERTLPPPDKAADGIGVVDAATHQLLRVLRGVSDPEQLAVDHTGRELYVASEDTGAAIVLSSKDGTNLASLAVGGEPEGLAINPQGTVAYVSSEEDHRVVAIDTATRREIARFDVGMRPRGIAFSPDGKRAYVTGENDASVTVVDARAHRPTATLKLDGDNVRPMGVVVSPDGSTVFVTTGRGGTVVAIDSATLKSRRSVHVGPRPWGIAISPDGRQLYTANGPSNDVSVVDVARFELIGTLPAGQRPWGVAVGPAR